MKLKHLVRPAAWLAVTALTFALAGCDDDDAPVAATPPAVTVSGTAAVGVPLASASVSVQCSTGDAVTTTTTAAGAYTVSLAGGQTFPCLVTVTGGSPSVTLRSVAQAEGSVNVTPLTDLIVSAAAGTSSTAWFEANKGTLATSLATLVAKLPAAQAAVIATLKGSGYTVPTGNLLTLSFTPVDGNAYDDLLEAIKVSLANAGKTYAELVTVIASAGTGTVTLPFTDEITAAEVASMPQINSASLAVSSGVLSMKTGSGSSAVGAYVGGGDGNKAILQLTGLAGTKLKDFKGMTIDLKAPAGNQVPYVSVNIMIDLDCTAAPLPATATIAQMQVRHRLLTFDTYYPYIQGVPGSISSTEFKSIDIKPTTGGWRISKGAPADASDKDTGLYEQGQEGGNYTVETLTLFNHTQFPNACIVDGRSADNGLWRDKTADPLCDTAGSLYGAGTAPATCGKSHTGVFLFLGSSGNYTASEWQVRKITFNDRTFTFK